MRLFELYQHFLVCFVEKKLRETTRTEQAKPQLHFAPKIIKIHSIDLENELFEGPQVVPKMLQKTRMRKSVIHV